MPCALPGWLPGVMRGFSPEAPRGRAGLRAGQAAPEFLQAALGCGHQRLPTPGPIAGPQRGGRSSPWAPRSPQKQDVSESAQGQGCYSLKMTHEKSCAKNAAPLEERGWAGRPRSSAAETPGPWPPEGGAPHSPQAGHRAMLSLSRLPCHVSTAAKLSRTCLSDGKLG